jgi:hypothetical protein
VQAKINWKRVISRKTRQGENVVAKKLKKLAGKTENAPFRGKCSEEKM